MAFRQTFLWRFHRQEVSTAFRLVGDALFDLLNEAGEWGSTDDLPITHGELRAACDDLEHVACYLDEVAGDRQASELDEVSAALAQEASGWAEQLRRLVVEMRSSLHRAGEALDRNADPNPEED